MITWRHLTKAEPRLVTLLCEAQALRDDRTKRSFCANAVWYGYGSHRGFKPRLSKLVGWHVSATAPPILHTMDAYDVAYDKVYAALPNCRNCNCF